MHGSLVTPSGQPDLKLYTRTTIGQIFRMAAVGAILGAAVQSLVGCTSSNEPGTPSASTPPQGSQPSSQRTQSSREARKKDTPTHRVSASDAATREVTVIEAASLITVELDWEAPSGTEVTEYQLFIKGKGQTRSQSVPGNQTTATFRLFPGNYEIRVASIDQQGRQDSAAELKLSVRRPQRRNSRDASRSSPPPILTEQTPGGDRIYVVETDSVTSVDFQWDAPTTKVNGSPIARIVEYNVSIKDRHQTRSKSVPGDQTSSKLRLFPGEYEIHVTAIDSDGLESSAAKMRLSVRRPKRRPSRPRY